jgi:PAS domain S-box-containing protein
MKLQKKTSLILVVLLILVIVVIGSFITVISLSSYSALEQEYVAQDIDQAVNKIDDESATLSSIVSDWAPWDDTYDFINGDRPDYLRNNLVPESATYKNLRLNLIVMTNSQGDMVYAGSFDSKNNTMVPVPESIKQQITLQSPLLNMTDPHGVTAGILMLEENPMIIASRPIVHTDFSGTPRGVVIMGRYLDPAEVAHLASLTHPSLQFVRLEGSAFSPPPSLLSDLKASSGNNSPVVRNSDRNTVAGYALIKDIFGNDALVLQITQPRDIFQQGVDTTFQFILILLAVCLCFGVAILLIIDRLVLSRLSTLNLQVKTISKGTDASKRVEISGDDEFFDLAGGINQMLETIYTTQQRLLVSETRFREFTDLIPQIIFELDSIGNLTYVNKFGMETFGLIYEDIGPQAGAETFILPEEREDMFNSLKGVANGEKSPGKIYSLIKKDGSQISAIIYTAPIIQNDMLLGFRGSAFDITERIALEDALSESQEYLQTLLWSVQVGIIVIDVETHIIIDANPAALLILKTTREELVNHLCHTSICPAEVGKCPITDLGNNVDNTERTLRTRDGRTLSIIKHVVPIMLKGRNCLLETFIDNSARKQIEEELRQSTDLITGILQASPVGVCQLDQYGNILFINDTFSKITGLTLEQINGKYWMDILHPEDRRPLLRTISTAIQGKRMMNAEIRYIHPDGSEYWLFWQAVPLIDHMNQLAGWVGTIADITERKNIEDALKESEEKYRALTENTPDLLFSADLNGNVTYISPQVNQYGYLEEDILGHPLFDLIHPEERQQIAEKFHIELNKNARFFSTFRFLDKWENIHWFEERSFLRLDTFGEPIGSYGVLRDVSERKRAEDAIELANKKLNLMNNITRHDILNTITGLLGCVDMANATDSADERTQLLLDIKSLTKIIQRQIAFTKEYQEVGVNLPVWQNVGDMLQRVLVNFEKSGLQFVIDLECIEIYADPLLEKVFYNLVDNAIRYGEQFTTIKFYLVNFDDGLSLICEDDGAGIPDDMKNYIFERGVGKNTGMGLFLSREILGITNIEFEENGILGKGARFEMFIPRGTFRFII